MVAFIKNYQLEFMKKKFVLLYLLNVTDIICTVLLLRTGYFTEINFLMVQVVQNPLASTCIKILFPALLLYHMYHHMKNADLEQLKASNIAVNISLVIYFLVNLSHMVWIALLPVLIYI